jgi:hypothetical protein
MKSFLFTAIFGICLAGSSLAQEAHQPLKGEAIAREILWELRMLDAATDQIAIENNLARGTVVAPDKLRAYMHSDIRLNLAFSEKTGFSDLLGHPYGDLVVDERPHVPRATFEALKKFVPEDFWKPFNPK